MDARRSVEGVLDVAHLEWPNLSSARQRALRREVDHHKLSDYTERLQNERPPFNAPHSAIDEKMRGHAGRAASLHGLAILEERRGNYTEARTLLRESIQIDNEIGNRPGLAASLHQLAIVEEHQG